MKHMSMKEGRAFVNGEKVTTLTKFNAVFAPEVSKKRVVGQKGFTSKVLGYDITGNIEQFKATRWIRSAIKSYFQTGVFPKFDVQAVMDDPDADFTDAYGEERIQLIGVQLTGDIPLIDVDAEGEEIKEAVSFTAEEVRFI